MTPEPVNPLDVLLERFAGAGEQECAIFENCWWSYAELVREIARDQERLRSAGIGGGCVVMTSGAFDLQHLSLFFALAGLGCVQVPLPEVEAETVKRCGEIANATYSLEVLGQEGWTVQTTDREVTNPLLRTFIPVGESGLVVFTSGSTGEKKAILHRLPRLLRKFLVARKAYRSICFLKLDHLGGINTLLHILSNGGTAVFPRNRTAEEIATLIETHRIELLPATPTFLNLLQLSGAAARHDLSSLQLITYGTEVMPEHTLARLQALFRGVKLQQTYGLSELGVLRSVSKQDGSLWVKVGGEGYETKIVDGVLWIRAESSMLGYLNAPSPFDAEGWFNTGDEVEVSGECIRIRGRSTEIINVGGEKVFPAEVETVLLQLPNVRDVRVRGERNPIVGQIVVADVNLWEPEEEDLFRRRLRQFCEGKLPSYQIPVKVRIADGDFVSERSKKIRGPAAEGNQGESGAIA